MSRVAGSSHHLHRVAAVLVSLAGLSLGAGVASADTSVDQGPMTLTVSQSENLPLIGGVVTVAGAGYDENKGIYIAVCVDNGPGKTPTPCLGGVDMTGEAGASAWISSNPPDYADGLTTPYGAGGSFSVELAVTAVDKVTGVDCTVVRCAVVSRADHTRPSDRSMDVRIPLSFNAAGTITKATKTPATKAPATKTSARTPATKSSAPTTTPDTTKPSTTKPSTTQPSTTQPSTTQPSDSAQAPLSSAAVEPAAAVRPEDSGWGGWLIAGAGVVVAAAALGLWWSRRSTRKGTA